MKNKIFIACDTSSISKAKKILALPKTKKVEIGYKFGIAFRIRAAKAVIDVSNDQAFSSCGGNRFCVGQQSS